MEHEKNYMEINLEQQKLISNPLRVKIIYLLDERPMTAKQVADEMGKTAGSIHYHIQQLFQSGILEIEETRENKGMMIIFPVGRWRCCTIAAISRSRPMRCIAKWNCWSV